MAPKTPPPEHFPPFLGSVRNGWLLLAHPMFRDRLLHLAGAVAAQRQSGKPGWESTAHAKLLKRVVDLITVEIPRHPAATEYEQGNTLGADARGWRRAKFLQRFRLFFRFDSRSKIIIYAWVNDEGTLRKAGSATDPYTVFRKMLLAGDPPHDWDKLMQACRGELPEPERQALDAILGPVTAAPDAESAKPVNASKGKKSRTRK